MYMYIYIYVCMYTYIHTYVPVFAVINVRMVVRASSQPNDVHIFVFGVYLKEDAVVRMTRIMLCTKPVDIIQAGRRR